MFPCLLGFLFSFAVSAQTPETKGRWISTSPQVTEWLFELGLGHHVIGTPEFSDSPAEAKKIAKLGPLFAPSIERTVRWGPQRVLVDTSITPPAYQHALETLGIARQAISLEKLDTLLAASEILVHEEKSESGFAILSKIKSCLARLKSKTFKPFKFVALVWMSPPMIFSEQTLLSELLTLLGGTNVFAKPKTSGYPQVSLEWLMAQAPDRVYFLADFPDDVLLGHKTIEKWWLNRSPVSMALSTNIFSRSNFSPLFHLPLLLPEMGESLPEVCRALAL